MALIAMKFGGTSVGSVEKIRNVARIVADVKNQGNDVVVAVSAMSGETDRLVGLVNEVSPHANPREYDQVVSTGEQVTIGLLSLALQEMGHDAVSFTGWQMGMITDSAHTKARIEEIRADRIKKAISEGKAVIVAGFQGITQDTHDVATLGRGGSDTTAVAVAVGLNADRCDIYTDVDGVYTTDPRIVSEARRLKIISYDEMLEMASLGAKVLQTRSVEFAKKYNMPVRVRSTFKPEDDGTLVTTEEDPNMEQVMISGIAFNKNEAKITLTRVKDQPGLASTIFSAIAEKNVNVDVIIQNISPRGDGETDLSFTVPKNEAHNAVAAVQGLKDSHQIGDILLDEKVSKVSIVGAGMHSHAGVAAKMFTALADEGINIMMISTSEIKVSCVIAEKYTELAVRALHEAFELDKDGN